MNGMIGSSSELDGLTMLNLSAKTENADTGVSSMSVDARPNPATRPLASTLTEYCAPRPSTVTIVDTVELSSVCKSTSVLSSSCRLVPSSASGLTKFSAVVSSLLSRFVPIVAPTVALSAGAPVVPLTSDQLTRPHVAKTVVFGSALGCKLLRASSEVPTYLTARTQ